MQKAGMVKRYKEALERHYTHSITVIERSMMEFNKKHFRNEAVEKIIYKDIPCRVSFKNQATEQNENTTASIQKVKLFIGPDISIPSSSTIIADINGTIINYKLSSPAAIYPTHREYNLVLEENPN